MQIKVIEVNDYERAHQFQCEYLDEEPYADFIKRVESNPDLYFVAIQRGDVVGICYGYPPDEGNSDIVLQGIAVSLDETKGYARTGIGSKMILTFENTIRKRGYKRITVGSADDPKVEAFYLKNGFKPMELVAKDIQYQEIERVDVDNFETGNVIREGLRLKHNLREVIFIFEKGIG